MATGMPAAPDEAQPVDPSAAGGFQILIQCSPDGGCTVNGDPAKTFGEALKLAGALYQNKGENADAQFASGYGDETVPVEPNPALIARG